MKLLNKKQPLVSAIVSTYNSEKFIRGKFEDLLSQTIEDKLEIIIVNSGSQQNEDIIIKEYLRSHNNIKYIRTEERETIYQAWNRGIKAAVGKFITNSNTDDRLRNDAYEILSNYLLKNNDVGLVYADQRISTVENNTFEKSKIKKEKIIRYPDYSYLKLLERCIIGSQPMWRASLHFTDNIWFDESFEVCGDHEFWLNIAKKYEIKHLPLVLGTFYKSKKKTNKEYQKLEGNIKEVEKIWSKNIPGFLHRISEDEQQKYLRKFKKYLLLPPYFFVLLKILENLIFTSTYSNILSYSYEFILVFQMQIAEIKNDSLNYARFKKKYQKYLSSKNRIKYLRRGINIAKS